MIYNFEVSLGTDRGEMEPESVKKLGPAPHTGRHLTDTFKNQTLYELVEN
jgi:hypothetical protein